MAKTSVDILRHMKAQADTFKNVGYNPAMDVRVLIVLADAGYRVRILAPDPPVRSWLKIYNSKPVCMTELRCMNLITPSESAEALDDDFDNTGGMLVFQTNTSIEVLRAGGFIEQKNEYVN